MIVRRSIGLALAGAGAALAVAACSSGGGPPAASTTAARTTSPSPTVSPPAIPADATQPTPQSAASAFRYFVAVYNYGLATTDSRPLKESSGPTCQFCNDAATELEEAGNTGGTIAGGEMTVVSAVATPGTPSSGLVVDAVVSQSASKTMDGSGQVVSQRPAKPNVRVKALMTWYNDRWNVFSLDVVK